MSRVLYARTLVHHLIFTINFFRKNFELAKKYQFYMAYICYMFYTIPEKRVSNSEYGFHGTTGFLEQL
jgi:hypothetical protein